MWGQLLEASHCMLPTSILTVLLILKHLLDGGSSPSAVGSRTLHKLQQHTPVVAPQAHVAFHGTPEMAVPSGHPYLFPPQPLSSCLVKSTIFGIQFESQLRHFLIMTAHASRWTFLSSVSLPVNGGKITYLTGSLRVLNQTLLPRGEKMVAMRDSKKYTL